MGLEWKRKIRVFPLRRVNFTSGIDKKIGLLLKNIVNLFHYPVGLLEGIDNASVVH